MKHGFFITGTGTGVGKTFVTARLAEQARAGGERVFAFKPIETGCPLVDGVRLGEDQALLAEAAGDWQRGELRTLYCFARPLAPLAAARAEQRTIDMSEIERVFQLGCAQSDLVLVEGAGGWRVPITDQEDMSALAKRLKLPVIVVATAALGTINHSVLTVEAVLRDGLQLDRVILSVRPEDDATFAVENAAEICRLSSRDVGWTSAAGSSQTVELDCSRGNIFTGNTPSVVRHRVRGWRRFVHV
jgi:dethiobiotin synthetase